MGDAHVEDGLSKLTDGHEEVREKAARLEDAAKAGDVETATGLTTEITDQLNALAAVEEEVLYPAVVEVAPDLKPQVEQVLNEHLASKELLYGVRASESMVGDELPDTSLVTEAVQRRAADEQLIETVREKADDHQLDELAKAVEDRTAALDEANAAGRAIKQQEEFDKAGEADRSEAPDLSSAAARVRNQ
jgi:hypothetical protein